MDPSKEIGDVDLSKAGHSHQVDLSKVVPSSVVLVLSSVDHSKANPSKVDLSKKIGITDPPNAFGAITDITGTVETGKTEMTDSINDLCRLDVQ